MNSLMQLIVFRCEARKVERRVSAVVQSTRINQDSFHGLNAQSFFSANYQCMKSHVMSSYFIVRCLQIYFIESRCK